MLWETDLNREKELHLMGKCGGVYMTHGISNIQNTVVTENIKVKRNALKQLIFGIRNIFLNKQEKKCYER